MTTKTTKPKKKFTDQSIVKMAKEFRDLLIEKKAEDVTILDLEKVNSFFDHFIICTGNSNTHLRSLLKETTKFFSEQGLKLRSVGDMSSEWVIIDYTDIVVHLFTDNTRNFYNLDKLWSDAKKI